MKMWLRLVCIFLCVLLVGGCAAPSLGGESSPESESLTEQSPDSLDSNYKTELDTKTETIHSVYAQKWKDLSVYYLERFVEADLEDRALRDSKATKEVIKDIHQHWESYVGKRIRNEETLVQWKYNETAIAEEVVSKFTCELNRAHALEMYFFCSNVYIEGIGTATDVDTTLWTFVAEIDEQEATVQDHISLDSEYVQACNESDSNADKAQTNEQYARKWYDLSEQYVNRILQGDFDSRIKETVETIHKEWKTYADKRVDYELIRLQSIHGAASTVSGAITRFEYNLYRAHTLEMYRLCEMLTVSDSNDLGSDNPIDKAYDTAMLEGDEPFESIAIAYLDAWKEEFRLTKEHIPDFFDEEQSQELMEDLTSWETVITDNYRWTMANVHNDSRFSSPFGSQGYLDEYVYLAREYRYKTLWLKRISLMKEQEKNLLEIEEQETSAPSVKWYYSL